jgi:hypothetical protein
MHINGLNHEAVKISHIYHDHEKRTLQDIKP